MIKKSFPLRILAISFLVLALPLLIDSFLFFQKAYEESLRDAKEKLKHIARYRSFSILEIEPTKQAYLKEIVYLLNLPENFEKLPDPEIEQKLEAITHVGSDYAVYILKPTDHVEYKIVASSSPALLGTDVISYVRLYGLLEKGEGYFSRYVYSPSKKRFVPTLFVTRTIISKEGKKLGLILNAADVEQHVSSLLAPSGSQNEINFALVNVDGVVFDATDPNMRGQLFAPLAPARREEIVSSGSFGNIPVATKPLTVIKEDPSFFQFLFKGTVYIAYKAISPYGSMSIIAYSPKQKVFGSSVQHFIIIYTIYGFILIIGGGITYYLTLWMGRPLRQLSLLMGQVSEGKYEVRFKKTPFGFEINQLGEIFNNTLDSLLLTMEKEENERVLQETYRKELKIGQEVQLNLLPDKLTSVEGVAIAEAYIPALEVGGDFYDVYTRMPKDKECGDRPELVITIADAAGKGVSACIYALGVRSMLRAFASIHDDVSEVMTRTNNLFLRDTGDSGMFVTVFLAVYHPVNRILNYYSSGHVPAIIRRANGHLIVLEHSGMALGLKRLAGITSQKIEVFPGDIVLFYTNGLIQAVNSKNQYFSLARVKSLLQQRNWASAADVVNGLKQELADFKGNATQTDDTTILVMKIT